MSRRIVAVVVSLLLAVAGTLAVLAYVRSADSRALSGQQAVPVYVAQELVPSGTTLGEAIDQNLIKQEMIAQDGVPENPLPTASPTTETLVAVSDIQPGELVLATRFATKTATTSNLAIPDGMMAMSVSLADPAKVGQFVTAGSQIAIFDTFNVQTADHADTTPAGNHLADEYDRTRATRLLLAHIKVLAVGTSAPTTGGSPSPTPSAAADGAAAQLQSQLITVAVTQAQAEVLVQAIQTGTLYLGLLTDTSKVAPGAGVTDRNLFANR